MNDAESENINGFDATEKDAPRRRFFAAPQAFNLKDKTVTLDAEEAHHLRKVLRLKAGDQVFVFDGEGREYLCLVTGDDRDALHHCERTIFLGVEREVLPARGESPLDLTLAVALLKGEKFDLVVQKATELGVARITPVVTKRADVRVRNKDDAMRRTERHRRLSLEAAKQSGRARVPFVDEPIDFASLVPMAKPDSETKHMLFSERGGHNLKQAFNEEKSAPRRIVALVGAEGGWEDEEIASARSAGWHIITLGGRTLRAETAAITVTALMQHLSGDLN